MLSTKDNGPAPRLPATPADSGSRCRTDRYCTGRGRRARGRGGCDSAAAHRRPGRRAFHHHVRHAALVFYESAHHSLTEMSYARGRWSSPQSLGGVLTSGPAAIAFGPPTNTSYVFVRGTDDAIWYRASTGGGPWSAWASLGGKALGTPAASSGVPTPTTPPARSCGSAVSTARCGSCRTPAGPGQ